MKKITLLTLLLSSFLMFSQPIDLDYEDGTTTTNFTFNGVSTSNIANPFVEGINTSARVLQVDKPMGSDWFAGCGYQEAVGVPFIDMANGTSFTVKIYSTKANVPARFRLQADLDAVANTAYNFDFTITTANAWVEYTIDFSSQVTGMEQYRELVFQPDYDPSCEGGGCSTIAVSGTYYIDDLMQPEADPNEDATLSDLTLDATTITGFSPNTLTYNVELANGTMTAPTVAGVATQAGMGSSSVSVTQASSVPGTATVDVTAPNGTNMLTYTVNFTEAAALPPAAPTPPSAPAISIISDVYTDINTPQVDVFGGTLTNLDLNTDGDEEARVLNGGSGFQFNYFPGSAFVDISAPAMMHLDIYVDNIVAGDILRIRLLGSDTSFANIARITLDPSQSGTWVSVDLTIPDGTNRNDFDDVDSGANSIDVTDLALIQFNTLDLGSTLNTKDVYLSNIYFYGGTLSTSNFETAEFKVFPNPTIGNWNIIANNNVNTVTVFNILGKQVATLTPNSSRVEIDTKSLNSGVYFARIESDNGSKTVKLIKQ